MNVTSYLAFKYLFNQNKSNFIHIITRLTFAGIFIAAFAMTIVLMVTSGFDAAIKKNLKGVASDGIIFSQFDGDLDDLFFKKLGLYKRNLNIDDFSPIMMSQIIFEQEGRFSQMIFTGVSPATYSYITNISEKIIASPKISLSEILLQNKIVIGKKFAEKNGIKVGSILNLLVPIIKKTKILLKSQSAVVGAIIEVGFDDYDQSMIIANQDLYKQFFQSSEINAILLKANSYKNVFHSWPYYYLFLLADKLSWLIPYDNFDFSYKVIKNAKHFFPQKNILHWKEVSPTLLSSMRLEQFLILLIINVIFLISVVNLISLLYMKLQSKKKDIAILRTLGLSSNQIKSLFTKLGLFISMTASLTGIMFAWLTGYLIYSFDLVTLPDSYLVTKFPINLNLEIPILIFLFINLIVYFACKLSTKRVIDRMNISLTLRH